MIAGQGIVAGGDLDARLPERLNTLAVGVAMNAALTVVMAAQGGESPA